MCLQPYNPDNRITEIQVSTVCVFPWIPRKANSSAQAIGIPQYPCGNYMTKRLQHVLQFLLIHGHWQVGDVKVSGILFLLLWKEKNTLASLNFAKHKQKKKRAVVQFSLVLMSKVLTENVFWKHSNQHSITFNGLHNKQFFSIKKIKLKFKENLWYWFLIIKPHQYPY